MADKDNLMEMLSGMVHHQWAHWTEYMLDNMTDENIERWRRQIETDYEDLSEREKVSDRAFARKFVNIFAAWVVPSVLDPIREELGLKKEKQ